MAYEYENDVISELEQMGVDYESNGYFNMSIEVEEVYAKAKAFNEISDVIKKAEFYDRDTALDVVEIVEDLEDK
ncbi:MULTISPECIES: hypothetical protein [unclassified Mammaliicoccus]|uniref:hypothetical protein n=1 Tax=unclassified Mammaliicoccus TaxID=2803851 RepID=UPI001EFC09EC|nr:MULTISPECIES: hypothetical protein [unclassified Mammaliicoccus]